MNDSMNERPANTPREDILGASAPHCIGTFRFEGGPRCVGWSPDGTRLAVGFENGEIEALTAEGRSLWRRAVQQGAVGQVAWSPRGEELGSVGVHSRAVWLADAQTGEMRLRCAGAGEVVSVSWSPDGERFVCDAGGGSAHVFSRDGRRVLQSEPMEGSVFGTVWSPDGGLIVLDTGFTAMLAVCDAESGRLLERTKAHKGHISGLGWSPDSRAVCSGSLDRTVAIWDLGPIRCRHRFEIQGQVNSVDWSREGGLVAAGSDDQTVRLWRPDTGEEVAGLRDHAGGVRSVAFSPDGGRLASASRDGTVRIWDVTGLWLSRPTRVASGEVQAYLARQAATVGRRAALASPPPWVPRLPGAAGSCLGVLTAADMEGPGSKEQCGVAMFPDGQRLAVGSSGGVLRCLDLRSGRWLWEYREPDQPSAGNRESPDVAVSPDGTTVAWTMWGWKRVRFLRAEEGQSIGLVPVSGGPWQGVWSPDSRLLAVPMRNSTKLVLLEPGTDSPKIEIQDAEFVAGVGWSPDGQFVAGGCLEHGAKIFEARSGALVRQLGDANVEAVSWSPDGRQLATGDDSGVLRLWSTGDWRQVGEWKVPIEERNVGNRGWMFCSHLVWHPDGRHLALCLFRGGSVAVWDTQENRERLRFEHRPQANAQVLDPWRLAWSPDGAFLVSGHMQNIVCLWDTRELGRAHRPSVPVATRLGPLEPQLQPLIGALAELHRLELYPPLSLLRGLLRLTGGRSVEEALTPLSSHTGVRGLAALRWPLPARVGLAALLLPGVPLAAWKPPLDLTPARLREELATALRGETMEPQAPPVPVAALELAAKEINDRVLTLLAALGPEAVALDPGLPLRLRTRLPQLPALTSAKRRLLGLRLDLASGGQAQGMSAGSDRAGVTTQGTLRSLLPSQLAFPAPVLRAFYYRGDLLYRDRIGREPPRLRPVVLLLDVSPPSFGPVEGLTRAAAHVIATSLLAAGQPVVLVTAGGPGETRILEHPADIVDLWTERSLEAADEAAALRRARALRETLRGGPLEPVVVVLSHVYFAAEAENLPEVPHLRGFFVQYPGRQIRPILAPRCERWETCAPDATVHLEELLGRLVG